MSAQHRFAHCAPRYGLVLLVTATLATLAGCGGGGGGGYGGPPPAPAVTFSAASLTFASQNVGTTSAAQSVTLTNTGNAGLSITNITISGDFNATTTCPNPGSLAAGASCTLSVTFTPSAAGARAGTLTIQDSAAGSPHTVSLSGTGASPSPAVSLSATSFTFATEPIGVTSPAQAVTLTNTGTASLTISGISSSNTEFAETNTCGGSVAAGAACTISITFTPTAAGLQTGTVSITDNASGSPQTISVAGGANNQAAVTVDLGPANNDADVLFVTVTVCAPGTTTNCQAIDHVSVDTGSSGLRLLQGALNPSLLSALPQENASSSGSPLGNCVVFADNSYIWGPVVTADVHIAGESASSVPTQVISTSGSTFANLKPSTCSGTLADNTIQALAARGRSGDFGRDGRRVLEILR